MEQKTMTGNQPGQEPPSAPRGSWMAVDFVRDLSRVVYLDKILIFIGSLFLFILAIILMKEGARELVPLVRDSFHVDNPINSLGFGWLFAYVIMSGSPVAASALAFYDVGALSTLGTFTMITGSRLGASFIVLFIGFIYVIRGHDRAAGLSMGLISLTVTFTTYIVGLFVGFGLLYSERLDAVRFGAGVGINSAVDMIFDPVANLLIQTLPRWSLFLVGLAIIITSFNLFDRCLPQMTIKESQVGQMARMVYRPWVMFVLGGLITTISMSVSVSLSILVPLSQRGFIRRENVIPYIMGANITTFIDTLLATLLLDKPTAFTVVLVEMLSITIVSVIILAFSYRRYERWILTFVEWVTAANRNLALFMVSIFVVPLILMLF
jgi:solute carrier family 34 (sodium-dependent phosphate cotransporter)